MRMSLGSALAAPSRVDQRVCGIEARRAFFSTIFRFSRAEFIMHAYRTHNCAQLRLSNVGQTVRLAGWVHRKRDHGHLLFIDLRDHYGVTQCVFMPESSAFSVAEAVKLESVIAVTGRVIGRTQENINASLPTGLVEVVVEEIEVLSPAETLPFQVAGVQDIPEEQ